MTRLLVASALVGWIGRPCCWPSCGGSRRRVARPSGSRPYVPGGMADAGAPGCCRWSRSARPSRRWPAASASASRSAARGHRDRWTAAWRACTRPGRDRLPGPPARLGARRARGRRAVRRRAAPPGCRSSLLVLLGAPALAFLVLEQQVVEAGRRWKRQLYLELPVVAEQLGMLLGAGCSLFGALDRVARRGDGAVASDLGRVAARVRQGRTEADGPARVGRAGRRRRRRAARGRARPGPRDLPTSAALIAEEARSIRRDVQRELVETIERRGRRRSGSR